MPGYKSIKKYKSKPKGYRKYKTMICERCKFEALDRCQLDVHHKDGNHHNNDPNNLETLCANCHRLEHFANKDQPPPRDELREGAFFLVPGLFTWLHIPFYREVVLVKLSRGQGLEVLQDLQTIFRVLQDRDLHRVVFLRLPEIDESLVVAFPVGKLVRIAESQVLRVPVGHPLIILHQRIAKSEGELAVGDALLELAGSLRSSGSIEVELGMKRIRLLTDFAVQRIRQDAELIGLQAAVVTSESHHVDILL